MTVLNTPEKKVPLVLKNEWTERHDLPAKYRFLTGWTMAG